MESSSNPARNFQFCPQCVLSEWYIGSTYLFWHPINFRQHWLTRLEAITKGPSKKTRLVSHINPDVPWRSAKPGCDLLDHWNYSEASKPSRNRNLLGKMFLKKNIEYLCIHRHLCIYIICIHINAYIMDTQQRNMMVWNRTIILFNDEIFWDKKPAVGFFCGWCFGFLGSRIGMIFDRVLMSTYSCLMGVASCVLCNPNFGFATDVMFPRINIPRRNQSIKRLPSMVMALKAHQKRREHLAKSLSFWPPVLSLEMNGLYRYQVFRSRSSSLSQAKR